MEGAGPETTRGESRHKPFHGVGADWLCAVVSHIPTGEVESSTLFGSNSARAQFIREIGAAANRGFVARNGLEPPYRPHKKGCWRHQVTWTSLVHRLDNPIGQSHVVEGRQPGDGDTVPDEREDAVNISRIVEEVPVTERDAPRFRGGAGRVLEQRQGVAGHGRVSPFLRQAASNLVGGQPAHLLQLASLREQTLSFGEN